jgi:hypothetical protein
MPPVRRNPGPDDSVRSISSGSGSVNDSLPEDWTYIATAKWIVFALIVSLGSVYVFDLLTSAISSKSTDSISNTGFAPGNNVPGTPKMKHDNEGDEDYLFEGLSYEDFVNKINRSKGNKLNERLRIWLEENQLGQFAGHLEEIGKSLHFTLQGLIAYSGWSSVKILEHIAFFTTIYLRYR